MLLLMLLVAASLHAEATAAAARHPGPDDGGHKPPVSVGEKSSVGPSGCTWGPGNPSTRPCPPPPKSP
ncbi:hypothetical protein GQ55_2G248300 [Panicum hallii var. hallii]|uniref:Uncharacterized protein n=1 Tax=Panicum hallii var. hallii TaxID=1504633 RepID=A0A2T7ES20_9POAL|nr:hypothetical protein GQ55_2G248300 [Panicum hallii var. hallii]